MESSHKAAKAGAFLKWFLLGLLGNLVLVPPVLYVMDLVGLAPGIGDIFAVIGPATLIFAVAYLYSPIAAWFSLFANLYWNVWYLLGLVCYLFQRCL